MDVFVVHGTEEGTENHQDHKTTLRNDPAPTKALLSVRANKDKLYKITYVTRSRKLWMEDQQCCMR